MKIRKLLLEKQKVPFISSNNYWLRRYKSGGNSGDGSYGLLAAYKADFLNDFIQKNKIKTVIEHGCGDGNFLSLCKFPHYQGFDISTDAIEICKQKFHTDRSKIFKLIDDYNGESAQLAISLDVIFHLTEDDVFDDYMNKLFNSAKSFVIIYSSNTDSFVDPYAPHVLHRKFTAWVDKFKPEWVLYLYCPNKYPFNGDYRISSFSDFYVYSTKKSL